MLLWKLIVLIKICFTKYFKYLLNIKKPSVAADGFYQNQTKL